MTNRLNGLGRRAFNALIVHAGGSAPPLTFGLLAAVNFSGAVRTVFGPVGTGQEYGTALAAPLTVLPMEQDRLQLSVLRQDRGPKIFTDQRLCDALDTDTWVSAVIQQQAVPTVIVAALMYQLLDTAVLLVLQPRHQIRLLFRNF